MWNSKRDRMRVKRDHWDSKWDKCAQKRSLGLKRDHWDAKEIAGVEIKRSLGLEKRPLGLKSDHWD